MTSPGHLTFASAKETQLTSVYQKYNIITNLAKTVSQNKHHKNLNQNLSYFKH